MWASIAVVAALGAVLVIVFAFVYGWPRTNANGGSVRRTLSPTFARVYGLISIAILAVATVLLTSDTTVLTGVFTLFGTIAGYLAGAKAESIGGGKPKDPSTPEAEGSPGTNPASLELN